MLIVSLIAWLAEQLFRTETGTHESLTDGCEISTIAVVKLMLFKCIIFIYFYRLFVLVQIRIHSVRYEEISNYKNVF